jgi:hypothetical protein
MITWERGRIPNAIAVTANLQSGEVGKSRFLVMWLKKAV